MRWCVLVRNTIGYAGYYQVAVLGSLVLWVFLFLHPNWSRARGKAWKWLWKYSHLACGDRDMCEKGGELIRPNYTSKYLLYLRKTKIVCYLFIPQLFVWFKFASDFPWVGVCPCSGVPRNFVREGGGSTNSFDDRGQTERGPGGGSPLVSGSEGSFNLVQEI